MTSFAKLSYHLVFSTKYRHSLIKETFQPRLYEYIGGIIRAQNGHLIEIGGIEDHIHLLVSLPPKKSISETIREIKANASKWANEIHPSGSRFEWQKGYGAFTVSYSQIPQLRSYIKNQKNHHKKITFQEEYLAFLKAHDIEYDLKYLFEEEHFG